MAHLTQSSPGDPEISVVALGSLADQDWAVVVYIGGVLSALYLSVEEARKLATDLLDAVGWGEPADAKQFTEEGDR